MLKLETPVFFFSSTFLKVRCFDFFLFVFKTYNHLDKDPQIFFSGFENTWNTSPHLSYYIHYNPDLLNANTELKKHFQRHKLNFCSCFMVSWHHAITQRQILHLNWHDNGIWIWVFLITEHHFHLFLPVILEFPFLLVM